VTRAQSEDILLVIAARCCLFGKKCKPCYCSGATSNSEFRHRTWRRWL